MSQNYQRKQVQSDRRKSTTLPIFILEQEENNNNRRLSLCPNNQRRLSTISQLYLPNGNDYHPQQHIPATGIENQQTTFLITTDDNNNDNDNDNDNNLQVERRLSIVPSFYSNSNQYEQDNLNKYKKRILFIIEPIITGILLFPILVLFWETGWNLTLIFLNILNQFAPNLHLDEITQEDLESYTWQSLLFAYLVF
ncbi:unnamed protein product, partial [Rotaria sp. Silwood1]